MWKPIKNTSTIKPGTKLRKVLDQNITQYIVFEENNGEVQLTVTKAPDSDQPHNVPPYKYAIEDLKNSSLEIWIDDFVT